MLRRLSTSLSIALALFAALPAFASDVKTVLLFHIGLGKGMTMSAEGIEADMKQRYPSVTVVKKDMLDFVNPVTRTVLVRGHRIMTRNTPDLFDQVYRYYIGLARTRPTLDAVGLHKKYDAQAVINYISQVHPDVIVMNNHDAATLLISLRQQQKIPQIPIGWVHTDLVDETYFAKLALRVDMAFVGTNVMKSKMIARGVPDDRVMDSGLPLNPLIKISKTPTQLDAVRARFGLKPDVKTILLNGGANGVGDYTLMVNSIFRAMPNEPLQIIAACGRNQKTFQLMNSLSKILPPHQKLLAMGFIFQPLLFDFMRISDLIISKSGGLTPMELFYQKKPLILLDNNGAQERYNAAEYKDADLANVLSEERNVGKNVRELFENGARAEQIIANQNAFCANHCPTKIADWIMHDATIKPDLEKVINVSTSGDRPSPKGILWTCARIFERGTTQ